MEEYKQEVKILAEHVDAKRRLRLYSLLHFSQEMAIAHTELLGMGRKKTLDRGFLWIKCKEKFVINRLPRYDERITLVSSPLKTLHYFFPRRFSIVNEKGEVLISSLSLWSLIDERTRMFIDPEKEKIHIEGEDRKDDLNLMMSFPMSGDVKEAKLEATFSKCDLNGHCNNASYLDFAQDLIPSEDLLNNEVKEIDLTFKKELKLGESSKVQYSKNNSDYIFVSDNFQLRLKF